MGWYGTIGRVRHGGRLETGATSVAPAPKRVGRASVHLKKEKVFRVQLLDPSLQQVFPGGNRWQQVPRNHLGSWKLVQATLDGGSVGILWMSRSISQEAYDGRMWIPNSQVLGLNTQQVSLVCRLNIPKPSYF